MPLIVHKIIWGAHDFSSCLWFICSKKKFKNSKNAHGVYIKLHDLFWSKNLENKMRLSHIRKKIIHVWNNMRVSKWWQFSVLAEISLEVVHNTVSGSDKRLKIVYWFKLVVVTKDFSEPFQISLDLSRLKSVLCSNYRHLLPCCKFEWWICVRTEWKRVVKTLHANFTLSYEIHVPEEWKVTSRFFFFPWKSAMFTVTP